MKNLLVIFFLFGLLFFNNCVKNEKNEIVKIEEDKIEGQMIRAYQEGVTAFENRLYLDAAKKFNEAEILFPQSDWAPRAALMAAYAYYYDDYNNRAISELINFFKKYPNDPNTSYAHYLLAMSYYNKIIDEKKDLEPLLLSKEKFEYIIKNFPTTDFAQDAEYKLGLIQDVLASKEMHIAKYYLKRKKWVAAINRFKTILSDYETTVHVEEALHRLVETYYKIGLVDEAEKYASVLGYNYQSSEWYEQTYRIFNKEYVTSLDVKKDKKSILKKLKNIFK